MKRRNFLRDIALGIAATLVPRILMPISQEINWVGEGKEEIPDWAHYYSKTSPSGEISFGKIRRFPMKGRMMEIRNYAYKNES